MSNASQESKRGHRREPSWRNSGVLTKFSSKLGSLKEKMPRPRSSKQAQSEVLVPEEVIAPPTVGTKVLSFAERSKEVLDSLHEGYFNQSFDPLTHELAQLPSTVGQEELDGVVDKLASALEVVSAKLSNHVLQNHDRFVEGISTVASVESDLQSAHIVTCNARINLRFTLEEVKTNMRIARQTHQKQGYMGILEHLSKLKQTQDMIKSHQDALENGEYAEAIMGCAECFDLLHSLGNVTVAQDLRATVHNVYKETVNRMGTALRAICNDFRPEEYRRVLEGYMFQNITTQELSDKVLDAFKDSIVINSTKVVRSLIVTKSNVGEDLLSVRGDVKFAEICSSLPFDLLRPCLAKLLEILFDVMASYHTMSDWHKKMLNRIAAEKLPETTPSAAEGVIDETQTPAGASREADDDSSMVDVLESVYDLLMRSRKVVWDVAARNVRDLLTGPAAFEGEHFLQVMEWCQRFLAAGEAFIQENSEFLRSIIGNQCGKFFETYHMTNLEALETLLKSEEFTDISSPIQDKAIHEDVPSNGVSAGGNMATMTLKDVLASPGIFQASSEDDFDASNFEAWLERGNPFRLDGSPRKRQKNEKQRFNVMLGFGGASNMGEDRASRRLDVDEHGISRGNSLWSMHSTESNPSVTVSRKGTTDEYDEDYEAPELFGETIDEETQTVRWGESNAEPGQTSDQNRLILTNSAQQILKWMKNYGSLMRPLKSRAQDIFEGMCDLFDSYILTVYLFVSDMSLESLVWETDAMTTRLQSTIIRIMTREGSAYKDELNRIQSIKPTTRTTSGFQKENRITRDFKNFFTANRGGASGAAGSAAVTSNGGGGHGSMDITPRKGQTTIGQEHTEAKSSGNMYGLKETVVAIGSIESLAKQFSDSKSIFQTLLPEESNRSLDEYYRTVDAVADLKEVAYRNAARRMLHEVLDFDRGIVQQIASTKYDGDEISATQNPWAHVFGESITCFSELLTYALLPPEAISQMWQNAVKAAAEVLLEGFSRVEKCSMGGRNMMSLDLSYVEGLLKVLAPETASVNLRVVDTYIKAFYLPWEELPKWGETHLVEYEQPKIAMLVEHVAQRIKILDDKEIKRSEIRAMKNRIEERARELGMS